MENNLMEQQLLQQLHTLATLLDQEDDPERMIRLAVRQLIELFSVEGGWLVFPCDLSGRFCQIEYAVNLSKDPLPKSPEELLSECGGMSELFAGLSDSKGPIIYQSEEHTPDGEENNCSIRSLMATVMRPRHERPLILAIFSSSSARQWSANEISSFQYTVDRVKDSYDLKLLQKTVKVDISKRQKVDARLFFCQQRTTSLFHHSSIPLCIGDYAAIKRELVRIMDSGQDVSSYLTSHPELFAKFFGLFMAVEINQATLDLFKAPNRKELVFALPGLFTPETYEFFKDVISGLYLNQTHIKIDTEFQTLKGKIVHTSVTIDVLSGSPEDLLQITILDITTQKHSARDLFESREKYRLLVETSSDAIVLADGVTGTILEVNWRAEEVTGFPSRRLTTMQWTELFFPEERNRKGRSTGSRPGSGLNFGQPWSYFLHADGSRIPVEMRISGTTINNRPIIQGVFHDIRDRLQREKQQRMLATVVEQADESVIITDSEGRIEYVNPAFERFSGHCLKEVIGKDVRSLNNSLAEKVPFHLLWHEIMAGKVWRGQLVSKKKNGAIYQEDTTITPVKNEFDRIQHYVMVKRDITRQIELENHIRQSQKMQAIGTLAGGIAHDFNNILTAILGFAELSLCEVKKKGVLKNNLKEIIKACERAAHLIEQIVSFSRQTEKKAVPLQARLIVKEVLKLLRASLPANIDIIQNIESKAMIQADPTQLHQIIMNLCTNSYQALPSEGGWIKVSLNSLDVEQHQGVLLGNLSRGKYVRLQVEDNGIGIPPELQERIFEPFFTTKETGKGHGLGLSVAHGIVSDHRGAISVRSAPGVGSRFDVYFPKIEDGKAEGMVRQTFTLVPGKGNILIVDDEEQIVEFQMNVLQTLGYMTSCHTSGLEAFDAFAGKPDDFHLVITDMAMPNITGLQLMKKIRGIKRDIPVLLCSGYSDYVSSETFQQAGLNGYLAKPFTAEQLSCEVHRIIGGKC